MIYILLRVSIVVAFLIVGGPTMLHETTTVELNSPKICGYFESKGYEIPTERYHRGMNRAGKNMGYRTRYVLGSLIEVKVSDLTPGSHYRVTYTCDTCGVERSTLYNLYLKRQQSEGSDRCPTCAKRVTGRNNGVSHRTGDYGKNSLRLKLLAAPDVVCDISGEPDKRFLVVHHLIPRSRGGQNTVDNMVVLTANYHTAFHRSLGGNGGECGPEQYYEFREQERQRLGMS